MRTTCEIEVGTGGGSWYLTKVMGLTRTITTFPTFPTLFWRTASDLVSGWRSLPERAEHGSLAFFG